MYFLSSVRLFDLLENQNPKRNIHPVQLIQNRPLADLSSNDKIPCYVSVSCIQNMRTC